MISRLSKFRLLPRGFKNTLVLIPGWATDYRIFNTVDLNYNYLLPTEFSPFNFEQALLELLSKNPKEKISFFGYSLGGFVASAFAAKYPDKIDELVLLSIRKSYDKKVLKNIKWQLHENRRAYLYKFYLNCFCSDDKDALSWFKKYLLRSYLDGMNLENLASGLQYLESCRINTESLAGIKRIRIFHGQHDKIAPLKEALQIKNDLAHAEFVNLPNTGHFCFLNPLFKEKFYHG